MTAVNHPITLERVFFTRTVVIAIPDFQPGNGADTTNTPSNSINVVNLDENQYQATMRTLLNPDGATTDPYKIDMEAVAFLYADESLTEEEKKRGVAITAHSVLYGAIREAVSWITGRHPYGQISLGLSILSAPEERMMGEVAEEPSAAAE